MLDALAPEVEKLDGNFYYEFAEQFGALYGAWLLTGEATDAAAMAAEIIKELQP